jgi:hypothetical protein
VVSKKISRVCYRNFTIDFHRDPNLKFVEAPALAPAEVKIDMKTMEKYDQELAQASKLPLPDEDDEF